MVFCRDNTSICGNQEATAPSQEEGVCVDFKAAFQQFLREEHIMHASGNPSALTTLNDYKDLTKKI